MNIGILVVFPDYALHLPYSKRMKVRIHGTVPDKFNYSLSKGTH